MEETPGGKSYSSGLCGGEEFHNRIFNRTAMDPVSILTGVTALTGAIFQVVVFLQDAKDGSKDRLTLTTEVNSLWMTFKQLEAQLESLGSDNKPWLEGVRSLSAPDGAFDQIRASMEE